MEKSKRIVKYVFSRNETHVIVHKPDCNHAFDIADYNIIGFDCWGTLKDLYYSGMIGKPKACKDCLNAKETEVIKGIKRWPAKK